MKRYCAKLSTLEIAGFFEMHMREDCVAFADYIVKRNLCVKIHIGEIALFCAKPNPLREIFVLKICVTMKMDVVEIYIFLEQRSAKISNVKINVEKLCVFAKHHIIKPNSCPLMSFAFRANYTKFQRAIEFGPL